MTYTKILWIDDNQDAHTFLFGELMRKYKTQICAPNTNALALERAKDGWDIVFYDIGMDNRQYDLPVARKLRESVSPAPFIGVTYNPLSFYGDFKENFDDLVQSDKLSTL
jgi:CheY-like chemotaxis protein